MHILDPAEHPRVSLPLAGMVLRPWPSLCVPLGSRWGVEREQEKAAAGQSPQGLTFTDTRSV